MYMNLSLLCFFNTVDGQHQELDAIVCATGFPNWFQALGPNSAVGSGSLGKDRGDERSYYEYIEHYFPTTVYSDRCRSWYKMGKDEDRVVGLWPARACMPCVHLNIRAGKTLTINSWTESRTVSTG
ncbi:hypothetical protein PILCRDRAFT_277930 [Piloderma croceum F 1598]|uniref:Monooxygenase n=1 Tax=Piloderma croceum (strain F 1598) TaxID=765440 RepID=A0A0C3GA24_PILCF|nr:hypothetical protein PILCRDRAFT_277930 [Piloderma croceum F 1598]